MTRARKTVGRITFVGAGPGDPGLLTTRAADAVRAADLVVVDAAVAPGVVALASGEVRPAETVAAETAKVTLTEARNGRHVVRLVAGDPFVDDAAVKEALAVAKTVVPFEVVPGVTLGTGTAAYAGVPVGSVRTEVDLADIADADFEALAGAAGTLVLTVDAAEVENVGEQLVANGLKPDTPVAVSCAGTTTGQQTVLGQVGDLALATVGMSGRLVVTVGKAAAARDKLTWWESRPLYGWKVLVPRTKEQAGVMSERLRGHGAVPVEVPTIAVEPPRTPTQMERAIKGLVTGRYEWIIFTSTNAVRAVREKFEEFGLDARAFAGVKIGCVGKATAEAVRSFGIKPELVPADDNASSEGLLADFPPYDDVLDPIDRVLLPRADIATETLAAGLRELGWEIDDVTAYRTVRAAPPAAEIRDAIKSGGFQAVCFTSSSTVRNLVGIAGKPHARTVVACIGPQTAATATEFGLRVDVQPEEATVPALIDALAEFAVERAAAEKEKVATAAAKKPVRGSARRASR
ncbi:uroporphyrinogen III methyltransferase / synthase [Jatrophihabitans endophyticus]|uniref:Uroporphyrinogen III methyltransferase / synthase n=1 Tax=Jatrophihabitans endophyticus TaxID=1206085 RepID=A0A1M5QYN6_9ACTN|nr:uroporphyrinogen-III synthase [Jatrophihabitans endophyticus]SHH18986.1 uroporphyrinogen III methyltransferase / synthase [Jatrophihabitans endophyticus]